MKEEGSPITDDEWLYRRVHRDRWKTNRAPIISSSAFEPRGEKAKDPDLDGISLYRAACLNNPSDVLASIDPAKRSHSGVVRVSVAALKRLGLSIKSMPTLDIAGHVVIPELNTSNFTSNAETVRQKMFELAKEASDDANLIVPPDFS